MTYLSRLAKLGLAKETTPGTYLAPTAAVPFSKASYEDQTESLKDETIRTNDAVLQGLYAGTQTSTWDIDTNLYPDITGHFLRGIIGPDTVTPGVSTTLGAAAAAGATTISTAASIAANQTIQIDTASNVEYAKVTAVSGTGPYTLTLAGALQFAHTTGAAVVSQATHTFVQNRTAATVWPSYSLTVDDVGDCRGYPGCVMSELQIKIDPKGIVTISPKYTGFPSAPQPTFAPAYSTAQPLLGWQWTISNAGASSSRGLSLDLTFKRGVEAIHSSDGNQAPREIFAGALELDGSYKAVYETQNDLNLYRNYIQTATAATLTQPIQAGGASLTVTMSKSGYHKGTVDLGSTYVDASFDISAIYNATDNGVASIVLKNFTATAY